MTAELREIHDDGSFTVIGDICDLEFNGERFEVSGGIAMSLPTADALVQWLIAESRWKESVLAWLLAEARYEAERFAISVGEYGADERSYLPWWPRCPRGNGDDDHDLIDQRRPGTNDWRSICRFCGWEAPE